MHRARVLVWAAIGRRSLALVALVVITIAPASLAAQPRVQVRAETRIELRPRRDADHQIVEGVLRDDLGAPMPDREVRISVHEGGPTGVRRDAREVRTGPDGSFSSVFELPLGSWWVRAEFDGDEHHRPHPPVVRQVVLDRAHVRLDIDIAGGPTLDLDRAEHRLRVIASSEAGGADLAVTITENERELARGTTRADGSLDVVIRTEALGTTPSAARLVVRSAADAHRADAQTEVPVVRFRGTTLTLEADRSQVGRGESVRFSGALRSSEGPLARKAVGLWAGDRHLATVLTDDAGAYRATLGFDELGAFDGAVTARFESDAPWWGASEAPPIALRVETPGGTPWPWILVSIAASALAFVLAGRRRRAPAPSPAALPVVAPALELGDRRSLLPDSIEIAGRVIDARREHAIAGAKVRARRADGSTIEIETDASGRFAITLAAGAHTLEIEAPGYEASRHRATLPHRGEWSAIVVRLRSLRELAWAPLEPLAARLLPSADLYGVWTARDLEGAARAKPPIPRALPSLIASIERAAYAEEPPAEAELESIREAARAIEAEMDARAPRSTPRELERR
ncbi:carboxypeptidase-like regulatory domain-containing protein [Sandaracinus amylolyticus]|uniref:carboxypeptidase-like regulatory domain-containing protein n=1 Tax=Sandaracinus amylolyticus TaxID=927083 RepID=UPI001F24121D|nr:carboxypeptidase-like regulatory domain-containing protein [Sandaracinus amylolyticus]UJR80351.1 Hypothetical protein I5071_23970 [Sandaracinus amylolyticus]